MEVDNRRAEVERHCWGWGCDWQEGVQREAGRGGAGRLLVGPEGRRVERHVQLGRR